MKKIILYALILLSCFNIYAGNPAEKAQWLSEYFGENKSVRDTILESSKLSLPESHNIVWTTQVLRDGWGDLGNLLYAIKDFKEKYPSWPIRVIATVFDGVERIKNNPYNFRDFGLQENEILLLPVLNSSNEPENQEALNFFRLCADEEPIRNIDEKVIAKQSDFVEFLKKAELVVGISMFFLPSLKKRPKIPFIYLAEYGAPSDVSLDPTLLDQIKEIKIDNSFWKMGVGNDCQGIFITSPKTGNDFHNKTLDKYFNIDTHSFFNYKVPTYNFIPAILELYPHDDNMIIFSTLENKYIMDVELKKLNLEDIKIIVMDKSGNQKILFNPNNAKRNLTVVDIFPLSNNDFNRALSLAKSPVGITGNASFSDALSKTKLPFYHAANTSGLIFFNQIIHLAKTSLVNAEDLISYLELIRDIPTSTHIDIYKKFRFSKESLAKIEVAWGILARIIAEHFNVKNALIGLINLRLFNAK